jgi:biotin transport system substrate-specific component
MHRIGAAKQFGPVIIFINRRDLDMLMPAISYVRKRQNGFARSLSDWRGEAGLVEKLAMAGLFAVLTALAAQVRFYLPLTPVPFTGQVLVVLIAGFALGRFGVVSVGLYLLAGAALGWFSGAVGIAAFTGITAGYLAGFGVAAAIIGEMGRRRMDWTYGRIVVLMATGDAVILLLGSLWLSVLFHLDLPSALMLGAVPFLAVDAIKVLAASTVSYLMMVHPSRA